MSDLPVIIQVKVRGLYWNSASSFLPCKLRASGSQLEIPLPGMIFGHVEGILLNIYDAQDRCVHAESFQSCPTLCNPMDRSPQGSSVHGIHQARILGCAAMPFSSPGQYPAQIMILWPKVNSEKVNGPVLDQHFLHFIVHTSHPDAGSNAVSDSARPAWWVKRLCISNKILDDVDEAGTGLWPLHV